MRHFYFLRILRDPKIKDEWDPRKWTEWFKVEKEVYEGFLPPQPPTWQRMPQLLPDIRGQVVQGRVLYSKRQIAAGDHTLNDKFDAAVAAEPKVLPLPLANAA